MALPRWQSMRSRDRDEITSIMANVVDALIPLAILLSLALQLHKLGTTQPMKGISTFAFLLSALGNNCQLSEAMLAIAGVKPGSVQRGGDNCVLGRLTYGKVKGFKALVALLGFLQVAVLDVSANVLLIVATLCSNEGTGAMEFNFTVAVVHGLLSILGMAYLIHVALYTTSNLYTQSHRTEALLVGLTCTNLAGIPLWIMIAIFTQGAALAGLKSDRPGALSPTALALQCGALLAMAVRWHQKLGPPPDDGHDGREDENSQRWRRWRWPWQRFAFLPLSFAYQGLGCFMLTIMSLV